LQPVELPQPTHEHRARYAHGHPASLGKCRTPG
jgi:hypothetical protein